MTAAAPTVAPPGMTACPVHHHLVAWTPGLLLGLCPGCAIETAQALLKLRAIFNESVGR